jgi:hypothetical protein
VNLPDCDQQVDDDRKCGCAGKEPDKNQQTAKEFGESGHVPHPGGKSEIGDRLRMVMQASEYLVVAMSHHDGTQNQAQDEKGKWL